MDAATPPDATAWSVHVEPRPGGARLRVDFLLDGEPTSIELAFERPETRALARALLAAAGDGTERTFPRPPEPSCG